MPVPHAPSPATRWDFFPWRFRREADPQERAAQARRQQELEADGAVFAADVFVAPSAAVEVGSLVMGERSYVAAHAYVSGDVALGADTTVNPYCVVRGKVRIGRAVRIGAHTSILGFNHSFADLDTDMFTQPHSSRGITIDDDVWIGSQVTIVDGVHVGSHSVIGAGAVVTRDVAPYAVVAGNPARTLRDRRGPRPHADDLGRRAAAFAERARVDAPLLLERAFDPRLGVDGAYRDPVAPAVTVRAHCDAIEIADLLLGTPPAQLDPEAHVRRLRGWQSSVSGLVAELDEHGEQKDEAQTLTEHGASYHVLCVGYALDLLGSSFAYPVRAVQRLDAAAVVATLAEQDWTEHAWSAGSTADTLGTAVLWNSALGAAAEPGAVEALMGWLTLNADPTTGLWGRGSASAGMLQPVNGFYRASRGTFAQFGVALPYPERVVDTVLAHVDDPRYFGGGRENACNVLDVVHPLWLARRRTDHRADEGAAVGRRFLALALEHWVPERGLAFTVSTDLTDTSPATTPGLQGTEMWLAIIWLAADLCGLSGALGYRPRGIHRPEPAGLSGGAGIIRG